MAGLGLDAVTREPANALGGLSDVDRAALQHLETRQDAMLGRTLSWAEINTGSGNQAGLEQLAPILMEAFGALDAEVEWVPTQPVERVTSSGETTSLSTGPIIHVRSHQQAEGRIIFTGHYDTVFAPGMFETIRDLGDGRINGPGLADMKGGLCVMLEALRTFESGPFAGGLAYEIVLTPDEETGNFASADFLKEVAQRADLGLTFEPAMETGEMAGARKGSAIFDIAFFGRSAHAGRNPEAGRSAMLAAAAFAAKIEALDQQKADVSFNIGGIDGGGPVNIVPERAIVRLGARAPDTDTADWASRMVRDAAAEVSQRDGIEHEVHGGFYRPPKPRNQAQDALMADVAATGRAIGLSLSFKDTGGVCEGNNVFAAGTPNIDTLGVRGGRIHSTDEFLIVDSLVERAALTTLLLHRLCDGRLDIKRFKALMLEAPR